MIYVTNWPSEYSSKVVCHAQLFSNTDVEELKEFAKKVLDLEPTALHSHHSGPNVNWAVHFDIDEAQRNTCILNGAKALSKLEDLL
jgi:hypothetical protein